LTAAEATPSVWLSRRSTLAAHPAHIMPNTANVFFSILTAKLHILLQNQKFLSKCLRNYGNCFTFAPNKTKTTEQC
jgi:hypothetical protein